MLNRIIVALLLIFGSLNTTLCIELNAAVKNVIENSFEKDSLYEKQMITKISENYQVQGEFSLNSEELEFLSNRKNQKLLEGIISFISRDYVSSKNQIKSYLIQEKNTDGISEAFYFLGRISDKEKKNNEALSYYSNALFSSKQNSFLYFNITRRLSILYTEIQKFDSAFYRLNEAIDRCNLILQYSGKENSKLYYWKAHLLQSRAYVYREQALNHPDSVQLLEKALSDCNQSLIALNRYEQEQIFESDMLNLSNRMSYLYYKSLESALRLYQANPNDSLLRMALQYSEMEKAAVLLRQFQQSEAAKTAMIPDSILSHSEEIYQQILNTEYQIYQKSQMSEIPDKEVGLLKETLLGNVAQYYQYEQLLEKQFPVYDSLKYQPINLNLDFILALSHKKNILEYVISNEKLYAFLVTDGQIKVNHFYFDKSFKQKIDSLYSIISNGKDIDFSKQGIENFSNLSYYLYQKLIEPFAPYLKDKPLLVIPDGRLSLIPFEILIDKPYTGKKIDYSALPYLVKKYNISYSYSLTLLARQMPELSQTNTSLMAMAPNYGTLKNNTKEQYFTLREARDSLGYLDGARQEVELIKDNLSSVVYFDKEASEEKFKQIAGNFSVLHLAMHTLINNENPMYSKLIFTPDADSKEDGLLNTFEVANLKLPAKMVVLSACNSGFGKINNGEGIVGLSRGFLKAGCQSLVATLWSIPDESSYVLMDKFYSGIRKHHSKSESLSTAKKEYLETYKGMQAHPFYWSGYIIIGNDSPLSIANSKNWYWIISGVSIVLLVLLWYIFRKKKKRKALA